MAESEEQVHEVEEESKIAYKPPAVKSIDEIASLDDNDKSLILYKWKLLGNVEKRVFWPDNPNNVILRKMSVLLEGRPDNEFDPYDNEIDLQGLIKRDITFAVREGAMYRLMITFNVQREIVLGLRFRNQIIRGKFNSKDEYMVGSYAPKMDVYEYKSPEGEFPSGMLKRRVFNVISVFTDDDKNEILSWHWNLKIMKDW